MFSVVGKSKFVKTRDKVTKALLAQPKVFYFLQTVSDFPPARPGESIDPDAHFGQRVESILIPEEYYAQIPIPCEAEIYYNNRGYVQDIKVLKK